MPKLKAGVEVREAIDRDGRKVVLYGYTPGKICQECDYLKYQTMGKTYPRCTLNNIMQKKNWKTTTPACIFFKEKQP